MVKNAEPLLRICSYNYWMWISLFKEEKIQVWGVGGAALCKGIHFQGAGQKQEQCVLSSEPNAVF